jgi:hypothetical protein
MDTMFWIAMALTAVGLVLLVYFWALGTAWRIARRMRRQADELGFSYRGPGGEPEAGYPSTGFRGFLRSFEPWYVTGRRDDVPFAIFLELRGGSRSKTRYTIVEAAYPQPLPFTMRIGRETALARLGKAAFGLQDIETGDERFDAAARVKGSDPDRIRRVLAAPGVRDRIVAAIEAGSKVIVTEAAVRWETLGTVKRTEIFQQALDRVVPIVKAMADARVFAQE